MSDFNNNESKPVRVNRHTYNWLNKLIETQTWENCFYYISRQGLGYGFSFEHKGKIYTLDYKDVGGELFGGISWKSFLLSALINGYRLVEPLYKVVDKNGLPMLTIHNNEAYIAFENIPYEKITENNKKFYQLTEQQIKDYDERYWAFAVKIED
ncbi:DUF1642 domain-containing protein [Streptococcus hyovaginalis]|uniref:DUF1642 domain-containing protein n=1 Tax=Streptococcus hyovaginalis TaxID=149015 RepID=UPI002A81D05E|nr:DUF1642 domain-containing protein [Streptococcus hyovaginalis]MDY4511816.1 DUF1642 domain-containing protein [Streptococcus hyovaginalis]